MKCYSKLILFRAELIEIRHVVLLILNYSKFLAYYRFKFDVA